MDEDTTSQAPVASGEVQNINGVAIDDQGMAIPAPDETEPAETAPASDEPDEAQTPAEPEETGGDEPEPETEDKKLQKFARSQGLELDSPNAIKAAQIAMKAQSEATKNYQRSAELEKASKITDEQIDPAATPEQRDNIRVRNLELKYDIQQWKMSNQDKLTHESEMVAVLTDPNKRLLVQEGLLSLDDVYAIARGSANESSIRSQGGKEALQKLAHKQQAAVPRGNAVSSTSPSSKITPQNVDQMVAAMSAEEYRKRLPEINAAMAG